MDVLTEQEMATRLDFRAPLKTETDERPSMWCIPFEYGMCAKGTRISISKAREIAAELRAAIAQEERAELFRAFKQEQARVKSYERHLAERGEELFQVQQERNALRAQLNALRKKTRGKR